MDHYTATLLKISSILEKTGIEDVSDLLGRTVTLTLNEKGRIINVDF